MPLKELSNIWSKNIYTSVLYVHPKRWWYHNRKWHGLVEWVRHLAWPNIYTFTVAIYCIQQPNLVNYQQD